MAQNKLTWQELRKAIAELALCSEKEADVFLNALISSVVEGLKKDKQVKIKGLGVFSLKAVAPRKSVNIATGEAFTIEGYNKLTFTAESMLKESVEKRIQKPSTEDAINAIVNDPIEKLGKQADEIVDLLAELGQAPDAPIKEEEKVEETQKKSKKAPKAKKETVVTDPEKVEAVEEAAAEPTEKKKCKCKWIFWTIGGILLAGLIGAGVYFREPIIGWWQCTKIMERPIKKSEYHDIIIEKHDSQVGVQAEEKKSCEEHAEHIRGAISEWWNKLLRNDIKEETIIEQEMELDIVAPIEEEVKKEITPLRPREYTIYNPTLDDIQYVNKPGIEPYHQDHEIIMEDVVAEEVIEEVIEEAIVVTKALEETIEQVDETIEEIANESAVVEAEVAEEVATVPLADQPRVYKEFIATEVVGKDSRLTWIAKKHYGEKDLWVFIYEANRNRISYPEYVTPGQKIHIPALDKKYTDLSNPELRQLVDSLAKEYLGR